MDINKVEQAPKVSNIDTKTQQVEKPQADFQFTLISKIEETALQEKLAGLIEDITKEGKKISKHMDVRDMQRYRGLIKEFMNEVVTHSHVFQRENFLDRRGRHRVYGMIKAIDDNLDELTDLLMQEEKDHLAILSKIDEIRGLLLDIFT